MITEIGESIEVDAVFKNGRLSPISFVWSGRVYRVRRIHGRYQDYIGRAQRFHYAVGAGTPDIFEICFNAEDMIWELLRIHSE